MSRRRRMLPDEIPELPGYITVAALSEMFDVDKGTIYYLLYNSQVFSRAYKVVKGVVDTKPLILLDRNDAIKVMQARDERREAQSLPVSSARALRDWNRRVKDWGIETGWSESRISDTGQPNKPLIEAYLAKNPQDVRPG